MPGECTATKVEATTMLFASPGKDSTLYVSGFATMEDAAVLVVDATVVHHYMKHVALISLFSSRQQSVNILTHSM